MEGGREMEDEREKFKISKNRIEGEWEKRKK